MFPYLTDVFSSIMNIIYTYIYSLSVDILLHVHVVGDFTWLITQFKREAFLTIVLYISKIIGT